MSFYITSWFICTMPLPHTQSDNDELNKTLPHNFKFGHHLTAPPTMQSPATRSSPIRSTASSSSRGTRNTTIQRRQPVAPNSRPSPNRFRHREKSHLNKSDPAIARNVSLLSECAVCVHLGRHCVWTVTFDTG